MKILRRIVIAVTLIAALAIFAAFVVELYAESFLRGWIVEKGKQTFDWDVSIAGDVRFQLIPIPEVIAESVTAISPLGHELRAREFGVALDLESLIEDRSLEADRVTIRDSRVVFQEVLQLGVEKAFSQSEDSAVTKFTENLELQGLDLTDVPTLDFRELLVRWGVGGANPTKVEFERFVFEPGDPSRLDVELVVEELSIALGADIESRDDGGYAFQSSQLRFGENEARGEILWYPFGEPHRLEARLTAPRLEFEGPGPSPEEAAPFFDREFDPHDIPEVEFDFDVRLAVEELALGEVRLDNLRARFVRKGDALSLEIEEAGLYSGRLEALLLAQPTIDPLPVEIRAQAKGVEIGETLGGRWHDVGGRGDVEISAKATGTSIRALLASATGVFGVRLHDVHSKSASLNRLGKTAVGIAMTFVNPDEATVLKCAIQYAELEDGVGNSTTLIDTDEVTLIAYGVLDLDRLHYDGVMKPHPKKATIGAFKTPYRVQGPLANLAVTPDPGEMTRETARILGSGFTRPVTIVSPFFDPGREDDPCVKPPTAGVEDPAQKRLAVPKTIQKMIGRGTDAVRSSIGKSSEEKGESQPQP